MSRVYWHTKDRTAELRGSERAWLNHVASGPADAAWDLDTTRGLERAAEILAMAPEPEAGQHGANFLHVQLREAQEQHARNMAAYEGWKPGRPLNGPTSHEQEHRLVSSLKTSLRVRGLDLEVAGAKLSTANLDLNTALVAGSDPVRLAAKIHGWCEVHCWVEGPDRKWLAQIIDQGLDSGIYRRGIWYVDRPLDTGLAKDQPDRKWSSQGWEEIQELLRESDDGPVVLSYSVCDQFPNAFVSTWMPPWPDGVPEEWDALTPEQQIEREERQEAWYDLPEDEQWDRAMAGLRERRPWARIAPDTLAGVTFGPGVNIYDLFAPDRDERIAMAFEDPNSPATHDLR